MTVLVDKPPLSEADQRVRLYELKGQKKPERWVFIPLVVKLDSEGKPKPTDKGKKNWTSEDAEGAYCLECNRWIKFQVRKNGAGAHMEEHHKDKLLQHEANKKQKASHGSSDAHQPEVLVDERSTLLFDE